MSEKTPIPLRARIRQKLEPVVATATTGIVLAGSLSGCGSGNLRDGQSLCTDTKPSAAASVDPTLADQLRCIFPEIGDRKPQVIEIAPNAKLVNFTDQSINEEGLKQTYAFFEKLGSMSPLPFTDVDGYNVRLTINDKPREAYMVPDNATERIFILTPNDVNPKTFKQAFDNPGSTADGQITFTQRAARLYADKKANVSFIFAHSGLAGVNTELCQSLVIGFANTEPNDSLSEQITMNRVAQESICNSLAIALTAVQNGISQNDFEAKYSQTIPGGFIGGFSFIGIRPDMYKKFQKIQPAIA